MDRTESCSSQDTIGSVKQAVSFYGGKLDGSSSEKTPSRAKELHMVKKDIRQFNQNRRVAEQMRSQAESEISHAKKTVKDLSLRIEDSKSKTRARKWELDTLRRPKRHDDETLIGTEKDHYQYTEVMRELDSVKRDLSKLKLDMAYLLETKTRMDKETEASTSRMRSYSSSIEGLRMEIEEVNEEQVLVELARIEAFREYEAIQAQREAEAIEFASAMENTRKKMKEIINEIDRSKELEAKLAITTSDANVLQNELKLVKAMGDSGKRNESPVEARQAITEELEAANTELAKIKEEGFEFMASMDIVRNELKHVREENARLKNLEIRADSTVKNLNFKLLRAKSKLEYITSAEEKAKAIVANLTATLQQLTTEAEAAKKEKEIITETASKIGAEIQKMESEIAVAEGKLQVAMKEFEDVKASEAFALESLKKISEKTMKDRASASQHSSTITISKFEYQYLTGRAEGVEEIADKKVAAAQAWIEALKASEKEILMKTEIALREMRELKLVEEQQQEVYKQNEEPHKSNLGNMELAVMALPPKKSIKDYGNSTAGRRPIPRRPNSPSTRFVNRSGSITLKKKTKVVPNLGKLFGSNRT